MVFLEIQILLLILLKNINKRCNWLNISYNPAITLDILENNPDLPWEWSWGMSSNPNIKNFII